ncbi:MAG: zinc metallopeptidase [Peptococcaceae bacterium]|nr:zinc metallopeptidase [Peptococcaceae bacterium]
MFPFYDPTMLLLIPAIILTIYAQGKISATFNKYAKVRSASGYSGAQIARRLLDQNGLYDVQVKSVSGKLSDHYDPRTQVVSLSQEVYNGTSIAAIGVAAHETGHAVQHADAYAPFNMRATIVPVASLGSSLAPWLIIIGFVMAYYQLILVGVVAFAAVVLFQLITLPVEFNASRRAIAFLGNGYLEGAELQGAHKVLNAAALTYVAAALTAVLTLLRFILLANAGRRND